MLTAGAAQAQTLTYDSAAHGDFAAPHAPVAAGQTIAPGWTDLAGGIYSVSGGSLRATTADPAGYFKNLALRPASENAGTANVQGTLFVPNGLPTSNTANGLALRFQPDGTFYLYQLSPNTLYLYKIVQKQTVVPLGSVSIHPIPAHAYTLTGSAVNSGGSVLVTAEAVDTRTGAALGSVQATDSSSPITRAGQAGVVSWVGNNATGTVIASYSRVTFTSLPAAPPSPLAQASPKIGFIGDSITAGYNQRGNTITPSATDAATLTVTRIAAMKGLARADAGVPWRVYDQGSSGSSTKDWQPGGSNSLDARAKSAFVSVFGKPDPNTNPVWVLLMLGTNDVRSDNLLPPQQHQQNVQAIVEDLVADGYNVVINHAPAFVAPTSFNGVTWNAASLALLQSYLPGEKAVVRSFSARAPGRVFLGDTSAFGYFAAHPALFQEYGAYGGLHPTGSGGTDALASFWARSFVRAYAPKGSAAYRESMRDNPPITAQVVCHGDSLTAGYNASSGLLTASGTTYPGVLAKAIGPAWHVTNIGTGGWPLGAMTGEAPTKVDPLFDPHLKENMLIIFGGTNDLGGGHKSAQTAFGDLVSYCRARHAAHPWRVLVVTPPVAAYPGVYPADFDAQMVQYDALIRRNWRFFADGLVDAGADPRLGVPGAEHNPVYFSDKDFTHLTDAGYAIIGKDAARAVLALPAATVPAPLRAPRLTFQNPAVQGCLGTAYGNALENLLRINTLPDLAHAHDASGLMTGDPAFFIRAGGGYDQPWTRDASLNSWNAASLLEPVAARNTLWAVCRRGADGTLTIQQDNQWWDKVIWITGAWNQYAVTGDRAFLKSAYGVAQDELARMQREHFNSAYGLFEGPAFFTDGIAGYPEPEYDPTNSSSFVLDHPYTSKLMALSTNCVYYNAYKCASRMATALNRPAPEIQQYDQSAAALKAAINAHLWMPGKSTYGYFVHGA